METRTVHETILVVDDELEIRNILREQLERHGFKVFVAGGGPEALKLSQEYSETIHLLITDVRMPGMNGGTLAARMGSARPDMKVLYMSGYTPNMAVHYSVLDPGTAFLPKPFTPEILLSTIRTILAAPRSSEGRASHETIP